MFRFDDASRSGWRRPLILGTALVAAWAAFCALSPTAPPGESPGVIPPVALVGLVPVAHAASLDLRIAADKTGASDRAAKPAEPAPPDPAAVPETPKRPRGGLGVTIDGEKERVVVQGFGHDEEFDSIAEFIERAPWIAGLVFVSTFLVFLVPLLIIALLIWYKVRKTRMLNETMLKLAEKGVIAPGDALSALSEGRQAAAISSLPASAPLYEQARQIQKRAAWSDLRKGVIMFAIGLGLSVFSMFDDGTPNPVGLVLLFLGIGYLVLWYFEDRETVAPRESGAPPAGGA